MFSRGIAVLLAASAVACGDDGAGTGGSASATATGTASSTGDTSASSGGGQGQGAGTGSGGEASSASSASASSSGSGGAGPGGGVADGGGGPGAGGAADGGGGAGGSDVGACDDGIVNGDETDFDCGGPCAGCAIGGTCLDHVDCAPGSSCDDGSCTADPVGVWSVRPDLPAAYVGGNTTVFLQVPFVFYDRQLERTVVHGGFSSGPDTHYDATYLYDGDAWVDAEPATVPPPHAGDGAAYDASRGRGVIYAPRFDVVDGAWRVETWEWDSATSDWNDVTVDDAPPLRAGTRMAYDEARQVVVLFGGEWGGTIYNDVWEWDGLSWENPVPSGLAPPPRHGASMAWVAELGMVVVYGGAFGPNAHRTDTWGWDGVGWTELTDVPEPGPGALAAAPAVGDTRRGVMVLFGGVYFDVNHSPFTWELHGDRWVHIETPFGSPPGFVSSAMVYDEARARVVTLFGRGVREYHVLGTPCAAAGDCGSGFCEEDVCCSTACSTDCSAGDLPGVCQ